MKAIYSVYVAFVISVCASFNVAAQGNRAVDSRQPAVSLNWKGRMCFEVNRNPVVGFPAGGMGNITSFIPNDSGARPMAALITFALEPVGRTYIANTGNGVITDSGAVIGAANSAIFIPGHLAGLEVGREPERFMVSSNPAQAGVINVGPVTGYMSTCQGIPSASPNVQQFTVSGANLSVPITVTAPTGFEISLLPTGSFTSTINLALIGTSVINTTVYVRLSASAPVGNPSNQVTLSSTGAPSQQVPVSGIVHALPTVNPVGPQVFTAGNVTPPINFSGTGNMFSWTSSNPAIGLPASGVGNIPSFTATNTGTTPIVSTITVTPSTTAFAYIANYGSNSVSVVNTLTDELVANPTVNAGPWGVSVSPLGNYVYVTNQQKNTVSVISTATNTVTATINVDSSPEGVVVSPDGSTVYVVCQGLNSVSVINAAKDSVTAKINVSASPQNIAINPSGTILYVSNSGGNTVSAISTASNTTIALIPVGVKPGDLAVSPDGSKVYVTSFGEGVVYIINATTNQVIGTYPVGAQPDGICVSPDGSKVYVANSKSGTVSIINTATGAVTNITPFFAPDGISLSEDGAFLYVTNNSKGLLNVVNTATQAVVAFLSVGQSPISQGNFVTPASGCSGVPITFTITVNPAIITSPTITTSNVTGSISACLGTPSQLPQIEQFNVTGILLTGDISVAAQPGLEVSLSPNTGYTSALTISESNGTVSSTTVYIRSSSSAAAGTFVSHVTLSSPGAAEQNPTIIGFIKALPSVSPPVSPVIPNGTISAPIHFTGTGSVFSWTSSNPAVGLTAASGTGDIPSFTAVNTGNTAIIDTVTVTPSTAVYAYIANSKSNTVSVINTNTLAVEKTITVDKHPGAVAVSRDASFVYIANQESNSIWIINTATNTVIGTLVVGTNDPAAIALSPSGDRIYVVNLNSSKVLVYNTATFDLMASDDVGGYPVAIAVSPDGNQVYVTNSSNSVSVINTATSNVTNIPTASNTYGVAISPDGSKAYVTMPGAGQLGVINTVSNMLIASIAVGSSPSGVVVSPDGKTVYVANQGDNDVSVVNAASYSVIHTIPVGNAPMGISATADGGSVYVVNEQSNNVSVINTNTETVSTTIDVQSLPISLGSFINSGTGCAGIPVTFTITVTPIIAAAGNLLPLSTTYGTASDPESITITGMDVTNPITISAPAGFEISPKKSGYQTEMTASLSANLNTETFYIRLAATTPVGTYSDTIRFISSGTPGFEMPMPLSTVNPAPLKIVADDKVRFPDAPNPELTLSYIGFVNHETRANLLVQPSVSTTAIASSPIGQYPITVEGASAPNYDITYVQGTLTIMPSGQSFFIPNTFTPNGDGVNDTWNIKNLNYFANCSVNIFTRWGEKVYSSIGYPVPWDGTYKGAALPTGTYYYIIDLKNGLTPLSGFVTIVR